MKNVNYLFFFIESLVKEGGGRQQTVIGFKQVKVHSGWEKECKRHEMSNASMDSYDPTLCEETTNLPTNKQESGSTWLFYLQLLER